MKSAKKSLRYCTVEWDGAAMGQLLVMLIVPPAVGVVTYIIIRRLWEGDENDASQKVTQHDPSAATPAERTIIDS